MMIIIITITIIIIISIIISIIIIAILIIITIISVVMKCLTLNPVSPLYSVVSRKEEEARLLIIQPLLH